MCKLRAVILILSFIVLLQCPTPTNCARILCLFPCPSKSHLVVFTALTKELARRGHELVVVSPYPLSKPMPNFTDIDLMPELKEMMEQFSGTQMYEIAEMPTFAIPLMFWEEGLMITGATLRHPDVKALLNDTRGFDLVIVEDFMTEPLYAFAQYFKAPLILISSLGGLHSTNYAIGNPLELAYWPNTMLTGTLTDHMTFLERLENVLFTLFWDVGSYFYYYPRQESLRRDFFGDSTSSTRDLKTLPSLVLLNQHFSMHYPRPMVPSMQEVGGIHVLRSVNKLPQDIQNFLDSATEGAIYFSMGSNLRSDAMPPQRFSEILKAFSELPQKVILKWESEDLPNKPANVMVGKWLPQQDILAHLNVQLFVTHGGLLSAQEAAYHGVPLVGIPIFGDQAMNMRKAEMEGYGIMVELGNVTKESILWAVNKCLHDERYMREAKRRSAVYRDQPQTPLERAVFWTEYVLRHNGAPHLRSAALDLAWYQLYLLDIVGVLLLVLVLTLVVTRAVCRCCFCRAKSSLGHGVELYKSKKKVQ